MNTSTPRIPALAAVLLVLAACSEAPMAPVQPEAAATPPATADAVVNDASSDEAADGEPRFIPYDTPPRLTNNSRVARRMQALYPPELKEAGVGGVTSVWLFIGEDGGVHETRVGRSSGVDELDAAALALADEMVFTPALHRDRPVAVWVQVPITFRRGG